MSRLHAVIAGSYGEGNVGDDALMMAAFAMLKGALGRGGVGICLGANATAETALQTASLLPDATFVPYRSVSGARLAVWGGGTQWCSFNRAGERPSSFRRTATRLRTPSAALPYALRRLGENLRPPTYSAALGVGIGPFAGPEHAQSAARRLRSMDFVAVRDDVSRSYCEEWGIRDVVAGADLCFVASDPLVNSRAGAGRKLSVGVVIRDWPHDVAGAAYVEPTRKAVAALRDEGHRIEYVSFAPHKDTEWLRSLRNDREKFVAWNPTMHSVQEFARSLAGYDCVISARYHGAIFAALGGVPVICVEIEPKMRIAAETVGGLLWRQPFSETELIGLVAALEQDYSKHAARVAAAVAVEKRKASSMADLFHDFVLDRLRPLAETPKALRPTGRAAAGSDASGR
jgi:polysaccharide pyruvyl transferase WcaK-like protein